VERLKGGGGKERNILEKRQGDRKTAREGLVFGPSRKERAKGEEKSRRFIWERETEGGNSKPLKVSLQKFGGWVLRGFQEKCW